MALERLPVDEYLPSIIAEVADRRAAVITAAPGAGKTTRVPPSLLDAGPVIVLQPRRVAARAIARRVAGERGWRLGEEVGWQVRFDRRFTPATRLLIVTEGILTSRLCADPLLSDFATIVFDEFHERSIHADVALALARQAWLARTDLRIVVMSATIAAAPLLDYLPGCVQIDVPGRTHPVEVEYVPSRPVARAVLDALGRTAGDVLAFLPGAREIQRELAEVSRLTGADVDAIPLHGSLDAEAQDRVFAPGPRRRVILATNIAETSITVPRVTAVVDTGFQKVARYDAARGIDSLDLERVTQDAADQRAGRAGRVAAGLAVRLWDARDRLRPHREPDIVRVDLAAPVLDVLAWGGDPASLQWLERPPQESLAAATRLLDRLRATRDGTLTPLGRELQRLPLHPRLARILLSAAGAWEAAVACAALAERTFIPERLAATSCDLLPAIDDFDRLPSHVQSIAKDIHRLARRAGPQAPRRIGETELRRAIFAGYPDRVAERRAPGSPRFLLASGTGAVLAPESGVLAAALVVALDVRADNTRPVRGGPAEALVRIASAVDREWLEPNAIEVLHRLDDDSGSVRAVEVSRYDALTLAERHVAVDPETASSLVAAAILRRGPSPDDRRLLARLAFAGIPATFERMVTRASAGTTRIHDVSLDAALSAEETRVLGRLAPERLRLPSGRSTTLDYREDGTVAAAAKLQELFGLAETPRIGARREPVLFQLLAPNGRPVQTTRDLRSFWERTYPEVRKELRGRYPKHPWPDDPWTAAPTARTRRKPR